MLTVDLQGQKNTKIFAVCWGGEVGDRVIDGVALCRQCECYKVDLSFGELPLFQGLTLSSAQCIAEETAERGLYVLLGHSHK